MLTSMVWLNSLFLVGIEKRIMLSNIDFDHWLAEITHWIKPVLMLVLGIVLLLFAKSVKRLGEEKKIQRDGLSIFGVVQSRLHLKKML